MLCHVHVIRTLCDTLRSFDKNVLSPLIMELRSQVCMPFEVQWAGKYARAFFSRLYRLSPV